MKLYHYDLNNGDRLMGHVTTEGLFYADTPEQVIDGVLQTWPFHTNVERDEVCGAIYEVGAPGTNPGPPEMRLVWQREEHMIHRKRKGGER